MKVEFVDAKYIKKAIKKCEGKHVQQIAYSSYHDALTQICFGCSKVRTSMKKEDAGWSSPNLNKTHNTRTTEAKK